MRMLRFPSTHFIKVFPLFANLEGPRRVHARNAVVLHEFAYFGVQLGLSFGKFLAAHDVSSSDRRARLYDKMARDLEEHGAAFLRGGETSQSLSLSDLFSVKDGAVTPTLKVWRGMNITEDDTCFLSLGMPLVLMLCFV